jgi:hypothetical protein
MYQDEALAHLEPEIKRTLDQNFNGSSRCHNLLLVRNFPFTKETYKMCAIRGGGARLEAEALPALKRQGERQECCSGEGEILKGYLVK